MCTVVQHMSGNFGIGLVPRAPLCSLPKPTEKKGDRGAMDLEFRAEDL